MLKHQTKQYRVKTFCLNCGTKGKKVEVPRGILVTDHLVNVGCEFCGCKDLGGMVK